MKTKGAGGKEDASSSPPLIWAGIEGRNIVHALLVAGIASRPRRGTIDVAVPMSASVIALAPFLSRKMGKAIHI